MKLTITDVILIVQTVVLTATLAVLVWQTIKLRNSINASNYSSMITMLKDLRLLRIEKPELARVYKGDVDELSDKDIQHHFFNLIVLSIFETIYFNFQSGVIDCKTWDYWVNSIKRIAQESSFRQMVKRKSYKIVNPDFVRIVELIVKQVEHDMNKST